MKFVVILWKPHSDALDKSQNIITSQIYAKMKPYHIINV